MATFLLHVGQLSRRTMLQLLCQHAVILIFQQCQNTLLRKQLNRRLLSDPRKKPRHTYHKTFIWLAATRDITLKMSGL